MFLSGFEHTYRGTLFRSDDDSHQVSIETGAG